MDVVDYSDDEEFLGGSRETSVALLNLSKMSPPVQRGMRDIRGASGSVRVPSAPSGGVVTRVPMPPSVPPSAPGNGYHFKRPSFLDMELISEPILSIQSDSVIVQDTKDSGISVDDGQSHIKPENKEVLVETKGFNATLLSPIGQESDPTRLAGPAPLPATDPCSVAHTTAATRQVYYKNDAVKKAVLQQKEAQGFVEKLSPPSEQNEAVRLRHRRVLLKRDVHRSAAAGSRVGEQDDDGDIMRKGQLRNNTEQLSPSEAEARDVLGVNVQLRNASLSGRERAQGRHQSERRSRKDSIPEGVDRLDPLALAKFRKRGRHVRGHEGVLLHSRAQKGGRERRIQRSEDSEEDDFTSSSGESDFDQIVYSEGVPTVPLTAQQIARHVRKDRIRADVELTLMQYRPENRSLPDEGGRATLATCVSSSQRPFASVLPPQPVLDVFTLPPKSSKVGGSAFGGHISFCSSIYAVLFCVKIKQRLGHETKYEIQRAFEKEAADGQSKRMKALVFVLDQPGLEQKLTAKSQLLAPAMPRISDVSSTSQNLVALDPSLSGGGFVTPRNVGGALYERLPPPLTARKPQKGVGVDDCGGDLSESATRLEGAVRGNSPKVTARGALLQGRLQHAEMKRIMSKAISASAHRMQHAKKQHCTAQIARAFGAEHTVGVCSEHGSGHRHVHAHAPNINWRPNVDSKDKARINPFSSTTLPFQTAQEASSLSCAPNDEGVSKLSQYLFESNASTEASAGHVEPSLSTRLRNGSRVESKLALPETKTGTVPGQRNFYILHNGWVDYPFTPPALVQAADYVPQAQDSQLRVFTRPESPLLPIIERLEGSPVKVTGQRLKEPGAINLSGGHKSKGILRKDAMPTAHENCEAAPRTKGDRAEGALFSTNKEENNSGQSSKNTPRRLQSPSKGYMISTKATNAKTAMNPHAKPQISIPEPPHQAKPAKSRGEGSTATTTSSRRPQPLTTSMLDKHNTALKVQRQPKPPCCSAGSNASSSPRAGIRFMGEVKEGNTKRVPTFTLPSLVGPQPTSPRVAFSGSDRDVKMRRKSPSVIAPETLRPTKNPLTKTDAQRDLPHSARGPSRPTPKPVPPSPQSARIKYSGPFAENSDPFVLVKTTPHKSIITVHHRSRANSLASQVSEGGVFSSSSPTFNSSRRGSLASNRSFIGNSSSRGGGGGKGTIISQAQPSGFEDLAARKPHGKSQIETQRELIKEHKKKRASFIDHKTNLHIQWRKETVAERIAKDYDFNSGAPATYENFKTASIIDHNAFLARATGEIRRVLTVREETSFPIKAKTLVEAVENVEKTRLKQIQRERRHQRRLRQQMERQARGGEVANNLGVSHAGSDAIVGNLTPLRSALSSSVTFSDIENPFAALPPAPPTEVVHTVNPAVSVASAIRSVEVVIANTMKQSQLSTIKEYNRVWVDKVRESILPYVGSEGFTPLEEKVFGVFKNYLVSTGGSTGVVSPSATAGRGPSPPASLVHGGGFAHQAHPSMSRRSSNASTTALTVIHSSASLKRHSTIDPVAANKRLFRRVLSQNFTSKELEEPNVQFLLMRMLPLFPHLAQDDVVGFLRERNVPFHLVTGEFEAIFSAYVSDADEAHRRLKERRIDRHLAFHANVSRKLDRIERVVRAEKGL